MNPSPTFTTGDYLVVKERDKEIYVPVLQNTLNTLGYNNGTFGNNTKNTLLRYQNDKGLIADRTV